MIDGEIIMLAGHMADNLKNNGTASRGAGHGFLGKALRGEAESVGDNVMFESFININRALMFTISEIPDLAPHARHLARTGEVVCYAFLSPAMLAPRFIVSLAEVSEP